MKLDPATKPIRAIIKLQNNCLRARRMALGLSTHEIAERVGISYSTYLCLENLKRRPLDTRLEEETWTKAAEKLASFYQVLPENLFPLVVLAVDKPVTSREFDESEIQALLPDYMRNEALGPEEAISQNQLRGTVTRALKMLKPTEEEVVRRYYGLDSGTSMLSTQIGEEIGRTRSRVDQILNKAIHKLRRVVPNRLTLPPLAPDELGHGTRCIRHNRRNIHEAPDPGLPFTMNVQLNMPDPDSHPQIECLQFQGLTVQMLIDAADSSTLSTNLRLLTISIFDRYGHVRRQKEGSHGAWTIPVTTWKGESSTTPP